MAKDKKGFVLYADMQEVFNELDDKDAGQLIRHIFAYVNDENPKTDNPMVKISFIPIKRQLKRDLEKYEQVREKRSIAGKKSAEIRQQTATKSTSVESVEQTATKSTVIDNVNVTDKVKDINKESFLLFLKYVNTKLGKKYRFTDKVFSSYKIRLKEYTKDEIKKSVDNACLDSYHIEKGFKYLTPEFLLREDKIEKFLNAQSTIRPKKKLAY